MGTNKTRNPAVGGTNKTRDSWSTGGDQTWDESTGTWANRTDPWSPTGIPGGSNAGTNKTRN